MSMIKKKLAARVNVVQDAEGRDTVLRNCGIDLLVDSRSGECMSYGGDCKYGLKPNCPAVVRYLSANPSRLELYRESVQA